MKNILLITFVCFIGHLFAQDGQKGDAFKDLSKPTGKTHVILIGVSDYKDFPQLDYSDDDAQLMKEYLSTWSDVSIKTFINDQAVSKDSIGAEIDMTLNNEAEEGDLVIIYFSGHGDVDPKYNDGYLLLGSAQKPSAKTYRFNQALSMNDLEDMMNYAAKGGVNVLLITDACKSGAILNARDANQRMLEIGSNTVSLVSCGPQESSYESSVLENGIFTFYLVQGLSGLADGNGDKKITYRELERYLEDNVDVAAKQENSSNKQNPVTRISDKTKLITNVQEDLLSDAEKRNKLIEEKRWNGGHEDMASRGKGVAPSFNSLGGTSAYLLKLMNQLVDDRIVFPDEVEGKGTSSMDAGNSKMIKSSSSPVYMMSASHDGKYIASTSNKDVAVYNKDMELVRKLSGHRGGVTSVAFRPNEHQVASGSWDNSVILWDAVTGKQISAVKKLSDESYALKFINHDLLAIGTSRGDLYVWNIQSNENKKYPLGRKRISAIDCSGPMLFVAMADGTVRVFDTESRKEVESFKAHSGSVNGLKYAPLSNVLYTVGNDKQLNCWDVSTYTKIRSHGLNYSENRDIDLDPFENYCFVSSRRYDMDVIKLADDQTMSRMFSSHSSGLVSVLFNQASSQLLMGDSKGRLHVNEIQLKQSNFSAIDIYNMLLARKDIQQMQYRVDGSLQLGLNKVISEVLNPLVNGDPVLPSLEDIKRTKRYAEKASEIGSRNEYNKKKLAINLMLLEIFEIIHSNDEGKYQEAISKIDKIIKMDPKGAYAYNISGALLARLNKLSEAKAKAGSAEDLAPLWAEAPCGTGKILFQEKSYNEAEAKFLETIEKDPSLSKGYYNLAKLYNYIGRVEEGKVQIDQARKINPKVPSILLEEMNNNFLRGDLSKVKRASEKEELKDFPEALVARSDVEFLEARENTQFDVLQERYLKAYKIDSNNVNSILALGYFYLRILDNKKAADFIEENYAQKSGDRPIKGKTMLKRECKRLFNRCEKMAPYDLRGMTGDWMSRGGEVNSSTIESAISKYNGSAEVYTAIGRYYLAKENYKLASKYLKKAVAEDDQYMKGLVLFMEANKKMGKEKKNVKLISQLSSDANKKDILKFRKEITSYLLLY